MIVLTVLAALAGSLVVSLESSNRDAHAAVAARTLEELRAALLRFRRDTGYLPGQGPFAVDPAEQNGVRPHAPAGSVPGVFADDAEWQLWFANPANLIVLIQPPRSPGSSAPVSAYDWELVGPAAQLATWDPTRKRGWNGPYLRPDLAEWVHVGAGFLADGSTLPTDGALLPVLPAIASSHAVPPPALGDDTLRWQSSAQSTTTLDVIHGRPLYLFSAGRARIVDSGPDGVYAPWVVSTTDLIAPPTDPSTDDVGRFVE
ncbi:MAG: hypothetical protein R3F62_23820 [Planctomycetota bacterium]